MVVVGWRVRRLVHPAAPLEEASRCAPSNARHSHTISFFFFFLLLFLLLFFLLLFLLLFLLPLRRWFKLVVAVALLIYFVVDLLIDLPLWLLMSSLLFWCCGWEMMGCAQWDVERNVEGFLKDSWRILEGFLKDSWRIFEGFLRDSWRILEGFLKVF